MQKMPDNAGDGPILVAYDGSDHAKAAIRQAGRQLRNGRHAVVLTVWEPLGALPFAGAAGVAPVDLEGGFEQEARRVAEEGAGLARMAGFEAEPTAERGDPVWQRIVQSAEERGASIVVMGSHGRTGIPLVLLGSIAEATARHTDRPVLIAHDQPQAETDPSP
jgi:nucleotide-binding universal stress UspA family protein